MRKLPERTCMGCNLKKNKIELIRIVKNKEGNIHIDINGKLNGRGAYICNNLDCLEKVIKNKRLQKKLETNIENEVYENLRGVILGK